jgi:hypothetical protein
MPISTKSRLVIQFASRAFGVQVNQYAAYIENNSLNLELVDVEQLLQFAVVPT